MDKIGTPQFHVMCDMWGVDQAIKAAARMGMAPSDKQIEAERQRENAAKERWNSVFKQAQKGGQDE